MRENDTPRYKNIILTVAEKPKFAVQAHGISLAMLYLAGAVRDFCDHIEIFDFNVPGNDWSRFKALITEKRPFCVGINCLFTGGFPATRKTAKLIRENFPDLKVVVGGIHATMFAEEIIAECPEFDAAMLGEGDSAFPALLRYWWEQAENTDSLESVVLRTPSGIIVKKKTAYIQNLDALPQPGYEYVNFSDYTIETKGWAKLDRHGVGFSTTPMPLLTSRSCPNQCNFCSMRFVMGNKWRARSALDVYEEISFIYNTYGINYFRIHDDNFTLNKQRVLDLCALIKKNNLKLYFEDAGGLMVRTLDEEIIAAMADAGFFSCSLAIESGSDFIRNKIMRKNVSEEKIYDVAALCRKYFSVVGAFFIIGMPEETEETLIATKTMLEKLDIDKPGLNRILPYPGTRLFEQCLRDNLFVNVFETANLWNGENFSEDSAIVRHAKYYVKPYNLTLERMADLEREIRAVASQKMIRWIRRSGIPK
jgi:radical SAM superfamily enzyme YgiQ (UPF0313 family)